MYKTPYSIEYKKQAVKLGAEVGVMQAAKTLGIDANLIYRWRTSTHIIGMSAPAPTVASDCNGTCARVAGMTKEVIMLKREAVQTRAEADAFEALWRAARR